MEISNREVLRYLGYRADKVDSRVSSHIEELNAEFAENIIPKNTYGIWDCRVDIMTVALDTSCAADDMIVHSEKLAKHLTGCRRLVLLAATLGPEADTLIRRYSVQDMEKAVIAQAVCAAMIEAYCDTLECEIKRKEELAGLSPTSRYSPGYGDFDITHQKDIINLLNCNRRIGLTLTDGYMLMPSKSISAVIGFSNEKKKAGAKCECNAELCEFREA